MATSLHPLVDRGPHAGAADFKGGTLRCRCKSAQVEVRVDAQVAFNHACGCTKCWKPQGSLFSVVGVVSRDKVSTLAHGEKLSVVDPKAPIRRHACVACGVHMFGRIDNEEHAFFGLDFIHVELSKDPGWDGPGFAAFVSSLIEGGVPPSQMVAIRDQLRGQGLEPYDCLSPPLMDALATVAAERNGTLKEH